MTSHQIREHGIHAQVVRDQGQHQQFRRMLHVRRADHRDAQPDYAACLVVEFNDRPKIVEEGAEIARPIVGLQ